MREYLRSWDDLLILSLHLESNLKNQNRTALLGGLAWHKHRHLLFFLLVCLLSVANISFAADPLLYSGNLTYLGAFRVPDSGLSGKSSFSYGGRGPAYNSSNNSLFLMGLYANKVAEISIPTPIKSNNINNLNKSTFIEGYPYFWDITQGHLSDLGTNGAPLTATPAQLGGLLVWNHLLLGTSYIPYDGNGSARLSHFTHSLTLSKPSFSGMYGLDLPAGMVDGYMCSIPEAYQAALGGKVLTGNADLSIISRTSYGPAAASFDPKDLGPTVAPATLLVGYPSDHRTLGAWGGETNQYVSACDTIKGIVFPPNTSSVLFFGTHGEGHYCYGQGTSNPSLDGQAVPNEPGVHYCYDPVNSTKGPHCYPYVNYVWAYNVNDLISVKAEKKNPWDITPYATWTLPRHFGVGNVIGAALNPNSREIYVSVGGVDGYGRNPVIEVYKVDSALTSSSDQLTAPINLHIDK